VQIQLAASIRQLTPQNFCYSQVMAKKTWVLPVDEEGVISFPEDLMNAMGWDEGTALLWQVAPDGSIQLKSADHPNDGLGMTEQPT